MTAEVIQDASMAVKKALIERALEGELSHTLGYAPGAAKPEDARDHRNGGAGDTGTPRSDPVRIEVWSAREGSFEPLLISRHERRSTAFVGKIVAIHARGMTVRELQGFLADRQGTKVSPEFTSSVAHAVRAEVTAP